MVSETLRLDEMAVSVEGERQQPKVRAARKLPNAFLLSPETHPAPLTFQVSLSFPVSKSEAKWITVS